jgi:hypothetical protein
VCVCLCVCVLEHNISLVTYTHALHTPTRYTQHRPVGRAPSRAATCLTRSPLEPPPGSSARMRAAASCGGSSGGQNSSTRWRCAAKASSAGRSAAKQASAPRPALAWRLLAL